jgi:hypothetical protein
MAASPSDFAFTERFAGISTMTAKYSAFPLPRRIHRELKKREDLWTSTRHGTMSRLRNQHPMHRPSFPR